VFLYSNQVCFINTKMENKNVMNKFVVFLIHNRFVISSNGVIGGVDQSKRKLPFSVKHARN